MGVPACRFIRLRASARMSFACCDAKSSLPISASWSSLAPIDLVVGVIAFHLGSTIGKTLSHLWHNAPAVMPFFLILPGWMLCVLCGIVLLCFPRFRRTGVYAITISTSATVVSIFLSTAVLYLGTRIGLQWMGQWSGIALIGAYALTIFIGALIGALVGFLFTRKLLSRR